jgi:uncharacterized GH25 family protein
MNCQSMKQRIWLASVLILVGYPTVGFEETNNDAFEDYDHKQESAWRERFEEELRRHGVEAAVEEKDVAFKEYMARIKERVGKQKELIESENKPLMLSGQVVDQDGLPVPNAEIGAVVQEERTVGIGFYRLQTIKRDVLVRTDASGNFTLDGGHGRWISIQKITAPGYQFVTEQQSAKDFYADDDVAVLKPSAQHVGKGKAVFKLWKQQGKSDKLVVQESNFRVSQDGKKHLFSVFRPRGKNLLTPIDDKQSPSDGDILFSIPEKGPDGYVRLRIEAIDGGITDQNSAGFIAPTEGYASHYDLDISKGDQRRTVFVRSRNGHGYTRMTIIVWYDYEKQTAAITASYSSNPQGRPNLQPGGEKYQSHHLKNLAKEHQGVKGK